jgi:4-diphosphocytidyl-2C-methyl-D-erythritol kinase
MGTIERLRLRAERSRRIGGDVPVVSTVEEARALARGVAEGLAAVSEDDRLLLLSSLHEVQTALASRLERLEVEMGEGRERIAAVNRGLSAHVGYSHRSSPYGGGPRKG